MQPLKQAIKQHVIWFLGGCFVVGAALIVGSGQLAFHLSNDEKVNASVLWLTSLAIFWYAYETYQLKQNTSEQVAIQEVIMQNEFLPILEPVAAGQNGKASTNTGAKVGSNNSKNTGKEASLTAGRFKNFQVRNLGRGPAKYIELRIGNSTVPLEWSLASGERETVQLPADARREIAALLRDGPAKIRLRLVYQDIYKRKFQTEHIVFDKTSQGTTYRLRQGTWDFKRIRT